MVTPPGYEFSITQEELKNYWPNLKEGENFHFTSLKKRGFKCIWYALMLEKGDIDMLWFRDTYGLDHSKLDHSANGYAKCFSDYYGFKICDSSEYEDGYIKIVLYEDENNDFKHVARVLPNGNLTSKMGNYEDIQHSTLESISGTEYGYPKLFMKKVIDIQHYNKFLEKYQVNS